MKKKQLKNPEWAYPQLRRFSNKYWKLASEHSNNIMRLLYHRTEDYVLELTLTFLWDDQPIDPKELSKRFNSFATNYLDRKTLGGKKLITQWIRLIEPHKFKPKTSKNPKPLPRKSLHIHVLLGVSQSINRRQDFKNHSEFTAAYTAPQWLVDWEKELEKVLPLYGFGTKFSLNPIKSIRIKFARYFRRKVRKYAGKQRRPKYLKGVRLVSYSRGFKINIPSTIYFAY